MIVVLTRKKKERTEDKKGKEMYINTLLYSIKYTITYSYVLAYFKNTGIMLVLTYFWYEQELHHTKNYLYIQRYVILHYNA